ncbi:uncharacterized protein LOC129266824 [Lytechinus pictus]|uniref:uncharacterized protein LOC129266824 n=1 Tax=Lytechinus pictus TaxID=7653 RepID=UPI0030BA1E16
MSVVYVKVRTLSLHSIELPTLTSSENLVESLCSMPHLKDLSIQDTDVTEEFCTAMKAKGASIKVAILKLKGIDFPSSVSLESLAVSLCFMPNLTDLSIRSMDEIEELLSTLKDAATSIQGSFPKISEGKFSFNGKAQMDRESFLETLNDGANP